MEAVFFEKNKGPQISEAIFLKKNGGSEIGGAVFLEKNGDTQSSSREQWGYADSFSRKMRGSQAENLIFL